MATLQWPFLFICFRVAFQMEMEYIYFGFHPDFC